MIVTSKRVRCTLWPTALGVVLLPVMILSCCCVAAASSTTHVVQNLPCQMYDPVTLLPAICSAAELANDTTYLLSSCNASSSSDSSTSSSGGDAALWPPFLTCPGLASHHAVLHTINIVFDGAQSSTNSKNEGPLLPCPIILCSAADLFHVNVEISNCHWNLSLPIIESTSQQLSDIKLVPLWTASLYNTTISYVNTTFTRDSALEVPPFAVVGAMEYVDFKIDLMSFRGFVGGGSSSLLPAAASATSSPARNRNNNVEASIVGPLVNVINGTGVVIPGMPGPTSAINVTQHFFHNPPFFLFLYNHAFCNNIPPKNFFGVPYCGGTGSNLGGTEFGGI
ncbi:ABC transporter, putative, partial [Bodo saltans]